MQVAKHKVVMIDYTLTNTQGEVLDSSKDREPLAYIHGTGGIIAGLENALEGKAVGDNVNVSIPPEQAYGDRDQSLVQQVPRTAFPPQEKLQVGMQFQAQSGDQVRIITIVNVADDNVTVDANHPLAGTTLHFDVTVVEVRNASKEELAHGHVHGKGGHHH